MNLSEMAAHVCAKVRTTDAASLARAKDFLNRGYETLWNEQLWREALGLVQVSVTPSTDALHAIGQVMLPRRSMANVIAVRSSDRAMGVTHWEELMSYDPDVFENSGDPMAFLLMRPVVHCFADSSSVLTAILTAAADAGQSLAFEYLTNGDAVEQTSIAPVLASATELRLDSEATSFGKEYFSLTKPATTGSMTIAKRVLGSELIPSGAQYAYNGLLGGYVYALTTLLADGSTYRLDCGAGEAFYNIGGGLVAAADLDFTYASPDVVYLKATNQSAVSDVTASLKLITTGTILTLGASQTAAPLRQRLRLVDMPSGDVTLTVLGKREFLPMTDYSGPVLSWCANCLMDFAQADMLERDRQYAKAQAKRAEAVALLDRARQVEVFQQAFNQRLIPRTEPDGLSGDVFQSKGYW